MKKKILIPLPIILVIIIIAIVVAILLLTNIKDEKSKLSKVYEKMTNSQVYAFTRYDLGEQHKFITYKKGNKTLIDMYNPEEHSSTLVVNGNTYLIRHEEKEYYVYVNNTLDEDVLMNTLKNIINEQYTTGSEKIYGKKYKYEEYTGVSDFLITAPRDIDENSVKTRFYFKGNELVYLKTIYDAIDEETEKTTHTEEIQTIKIEYNVEDSIFEIPRDYAEN